ncbi:MAG: hypothetical protein QG657_241, partial [Acidobacteriota bacterium]|nr:hypothetical protein [Acidobacteriota bacterium]
LFVATGSHNKKGD